MPDNSAYFGGRKSRVHRDREVVQPKLGFKVSLQRITARYPCSGFVSQLRVNKHRMEDMWYFMDLSKGATIDPSYVFHLLIPIKGPVEVTPLDVRHTGLSTAMFPKAGRVSVVLGGGEGKGYVIAKASDLQHEIRGTVDTSERKPGRK